MIYSTENKEINVKSLVDEMLNKTLSMFEWQGLPDTIPARILETQLQQSGYSFVFEHAGDLYCLPCSLGGEPDVYGEPTKAIISNPYLKLTEERDLTEGVLIRNDHKCSGIVDFLNRQSYFINEVDISIDMFLFNTRIQKVFSTADDKTKASVDLFIDNIRKGKYSAIAENAFLESLKVLGGTTQGGVTANQLIELKRDYKSLMNNYLGLSSDIALKKERLISSELDSAEDSLFPMVYTMMEFRLIAARELNEKFGLDVSVDFGSVWALKNKRLVDGVVENEGTNEADHSDDVELGSGQAEEEGVDPEQATEEQEEDLVEEVGLVEDEVEEIDEERERERGQGHDPEADPEVDPEDGEEDEVEENETK